MAGHRSRRLPGTGTRPSSSCYKPGWRNSVLGGVEIILTRSSSVFLMSFQKIRPGGTFLILFNKYNFPLF